MATSMDKLLHRRPHDPLSHARATFYMGPNLRKMVAKPELDRRVQEHECQQYKIISKAWSNYAKYSDGHVFPQDPLQSLRLRKGFVDDTVRKFWQQLPLRKPLTYHGAFKRMRELADGWPMLSLCDEDLRPSGMCYLSNMKDHAMAKWLYEHHPNRMLQFNARNRLEYKEIMARQDRSYWYP